MKYKINYGVSREVMVKVLLILITYHLSLITSSSQRLTVTKTTIDCGRTGYQQPVTATFDLRNKGLRHLVISDVKADCGCTAVEYPKGEIGIGEKFQIKMTYDGHQLGHYHKQVAITSNGTKKPVFLTMKGVIVEGIVDYSVDYPLSMGTLLLDKNELEFDDVNKGDQPVQVIHILNNSDQEMQPNVMHLPSYLSATVVPQKLAPGRSGTVTVTLNSNKLRDYGLTQSVVYMAKQLGDKVNADIAMGVSVVLLPDLKDYNIASKELAPSLQISQTDIDFTSFGGKKRKTADVQLVNTGKTTLRISSLQMFTTGLKVTLSKSEIEPGQTASLKITGYAEDLAKVRTKPRILMITNDPDKPKVVINIKVK